MSDGHHSMPQLPTTTQAIIESLNAKALDLRLIAHHLEHVADNIRTQAQAAKPTTPKETAS